jgi:hypothetical protein
MTLSTLGLRTWAIVRNSKELENRFRKLRLFLFPSEGKKTSTLLGPSGRAHPKSVDNLSQVTIAISFEVMLPSACSFIVNGLTFSCRCFAAFVAFVARGSEADSFRNIKVKHHTHLKMAM